MGIFSYFSTQPTQPAAAKIITPAAPVTRNQNTTPQTAGNWFNGIGKNIPTAQNQITVYSKNKTALYLTASDVKASGGEGTVYTLPLQNKPHILVKIYKNSTLQDHKKLDELQKRIFDMLQIEDIGKEMCFAWPLMAVFNQKGEVIGFAMNKCVGHSFLALSNGPRGVQKTFPMWDRSHLVRTAIDFVTKVEYLAKKNVLINDFNPANFLVNEHCEVSFIDCDSFQIPKRSGGVHITHTFFPSHVAPELLKDKKNLTLPRTIHQVEFGTAIIVFNLLMCGLHPYNYCDPSRQSECGTPDQNLLKGRCALGLFSGCTLPAGIWFDLWSWLSYGMKNSLIQTFRNGHSRPEVRTTLSDLRMSLEKLLYVMNKVDPQRKTLFPTEAKPSEDKSSSHASSAGNGQHFIMHF